MNYLLYTTGFNSASHSVCEPFLLLLLFLGGALNGEPQSQGMGRSLGKSGTVGEGQACMESRGLSRCWSHSRAGLAQVIGARGSSVQSPPTLSGLRRCVQSKPRNYWGRGLASLFIFQLLGTPFSGGTDTSGAQRTQKYLPAEDSAGGDGIEMNGNAHYWGRAEEGQVVQCEGGSTCTSLSSRIWSNV